MFNPMSTPEDFDFGRPGFGEFRMRGPRGPRGGRPMPGFSPEDFREHFGHGRGKGRGGRAGRGDLRTAVLLLLAEEPMHGYQLMTTITERTEGNWKPSPGAIYPTLSLLEDEGLITVEKQAGRKLATITEDGQVFVGKHKEQWKDFFEAYRQQASFHPRDGRRGFGNPQLMEALGGLRQVLMDVAEEDQDKAAAIVEEAIERIRKL